MSMDNITPEQPERESLKIGDVARMTAISERHIRRLVNQGLFPRPLRVGRLVRWDRDSIRDWMCLGGVVGPAIVAGGQLCQAR